MFIYVQDESDVITCIHYAEQAGLKITVRGGGHSMRSTVDGAIVIDTSHINYTYIDHDNGTVRMGAGCKVGAVAKALQENGLGIPTGTNEEVGIVGLSLLGGQGYLTRKYGLLVDNVVGYRMVTMSGHIIAVTSSQNADLFWALRGGGGRFGVVTEITVKTHAQPPVYAGTLIFDASGTNYRASVEAWLGIRASAEQAMERRLCIAPIFTNIPGSAPGSFSPVAIYIIFWDGPADQGQSIIQPLADAARGPMSSSMGVMPYDQVLQLSHLPDGRYMAAGRSLSRLDMSLFDVAMAAVQRNSNFTFTLEDYQGGRMNDLPSDYNAFGHRPCSPWAQALLIDTSDAPEVDFCSGSFIAGLLAGQLRDYVVPENYGNYFLDQINWTIAFSPPQLRRLLPIVAEYDPTALLTINADALSVASTPAPNNQSRCPAPPRETCCTRTITKPRASLRVDLTSPRHLSSITVWSDAPAAPPLFAGAAQLGGFDVSIGSADSATGCEILPPGEPNGQGFTPRAVVCGWGGSVVTVAYQFPGDAASIASRKIAVRLCTVDAAGGGSAAPATLWLQTGAPA